MLLSGELLDEAVASIRAGIRRAIGSSVAPWSTRSAAVTSAILIGDRAGLEDEVERKLQEAGTYHVIAISGGNIAILAGLCLLVLRVARIGTRTSALLVIVLLGAYASIVEGGASVGRATLMAATYFAAKVWDQETRAANVAALAAGLLLCLRPLQIVDAGFALTFGATLGILLGLARIPWLLTTNWWASICHRALCRFTVCGDCTHADWRGRVFPCHVCRASGQLRGDPADDRRADCGDGCGWTCVLGPGCRSMGRWCCARGRRRIDWQRRTGRLCSMADTPPCTAAALDCGGLLRCVVHGARLAPPHVRDCGGRLRHLDCCHSEGQADSRRATSCG